MLQLESLALTGNRVPPWKGVPFADSLRNLELSRCSLEPKPHFEYLRNLQELDLSHNRLEHVHLPGNLRKLNLAFADLDSLVCLEPCSAQLRHLDLRGNRLSSLSPLPPNLHSLVLAGNRMDDVCRSLWRLVELRTLDLADCDLSDTDVGRLFESSSFTHLRHMSLAWNPCGDGAVSAIAAGSCGLRSLDLTGTRLTFRGAIALIQSPHLASLRTLVIGQNPNLPTDAVRMLQERFS